MEAARTLRINYKTLAAALQSGKLTPRLCDALERLLMIRELAALEEEIHLRKLEIVLIGEHGLTLPPETYPWDSQGRKTQVEWCRRTLARLGKERFRAGIKRRIRRLFTLNRWRE